MAVTISMCCYDTLRRPGRHTCERGFTMIENGGETRQTRGRWGKRIAIVLVALPFLAVIAHAVWVYSTGSGLKRGVAAIQARGEPILPADFAPPQVPPEQNGGPDIDAAGQTVSE